MEGPRLSSATGGPSALDLVKPLIQGYIWEPGYIVGKMPLVRLAQWATDRVVPPAASPQSSGRQQLGETAGGRCRMELPRPARAGLRSRVFLVGFSVMALDIYADPRTIVLARPRAKRPCPPQLL